MTVPAWLHGARVAPSAHNTQPWQFSILPDGRVQVGWKPERTLPIGDPTGRDLFLALGAAVGWLVPADSATESAACDLVLAHALNRRQTARGSHLSQPIPAEVGRALVDEARCHGRDLMIVNDPSAIRRLAKLAGQATAVLFADDAVHTELWRWLRLDPTDPAYSRDGLTADCLELAGPTLWLARQTMPPEQMRWLARFGLHRLFAVDTERVARRSAAICLLATPSLDRAGLVETGRILQRIWLLAATHDLTTHPLSALLDCAETAGPAVVTFEMPPRLPRGEASPAPTGSVGAGLAPSSLAPPAFASHTPSIPAAIFRLGYTRPAARSPRLPLDELVTTAGL